MDLPSFFLSLGFVSHSEDLLITPHMDLSISGIWYDSLW